MANRYGQGNDVDRSRPHIFHRDYWILRKLTEGIARFLAAYPELRGQRALDFGAGQSPYDPTVAAAGIELLKADIGNEDPAILAISPNGRVPLPDDSVAAVFSTQVLEHVPEVQAYLREAHRLLAPNGLLYLTTHGAFILHRHPTDLRRWTIDGLRYELEQAGFKVESLEPHIGILAMSTHLRAITLGGLTRRIPLTGWLRPLIYLVYNIRMAVEDVLTPKSVMESHPELLFATARKN